MMFRRLGQRTEIAAIVVGCFLAVMVSLWLAADPDRPAELVQAESLRSPLSAIPKRGVTPILETLEQMRVDAPQSHGEIASGIDISLKTTLNILEEPAESVQTSLWDLPARPGFIPEPAPVASAGLRYEFYDSEAKMQTYVMSWAPEWQSQVVLGEGSVKIPARAEP